MKQIIIISIVTIIFIILALIEINYLETTSQDIIKHIDNTQKYVVYEKWDKAQKSHKLSKKQWNEVQDMWSMLIEHEEIDNIHVSLHKISKYIDTRSKKDVLSEGTKLKLLIKHIPETNWLNLKNVL